MSGTGRGNPWKGIATKAKNKVVREIDFAKLKQRINTLRALGQVEDARILERRLELKLKLHAKNKQRISK